VVDVCPVGSLLDKNFLFQRRVWELRGTPSVCPGCATGCTIRIDHADNTVQRLKPRFNPRVNDWWMCDEGRFGFKYIHDRKRIVSVVVRRGMERTSPRWEDVPDIVRFQFAEQAKNHGPASMAAVFSAFMASEEAWLLIKFIREIAPESTLVVGPVPQEGDDRMFPVGANGAPIRFTIRKEKCPNRKGIELLLQTAGGPTLSWDAFRERAAQGVFKAAWIVGGHPQPWVDSNAEKIADQFDLLVAQDMFPNAFTDAAAIVLPLCGWAEREGSFMNAMGLIQPFERAIDPPEGAIRDGQYLFEIAGFSGLYSGERVREMMAKSIPAFAEVYTPPAPPEHAH
jgi:NADH-quinone oxidoreductase subunit G